MSEVNIMSELKIKYKKVKFIYLKKLKKSTLSLNLLIPNATRFL